MKISKFGLAGSSSYLVLIATAYFKIFEGADQYIFFISLPAVILDWVLIGFAGCGFKGDPWPSHCDAVSASADNFVFSLYTVLIYFFFKGLGWAFMAFAEAIDLPERSADPQE